MSAAALEKCPWCSDAQAPLMGAGEVRYKCGSMTHEGGLFQQHPSCEASVLRKRVEELEKMHSWRPIRTCPHNLEWVLGYDEKDGEIGMIIYDWETTADFTMRSWTDGMRTWTPTHWMPLPDPPKEKGTQ